MLKTTLLMFAMALTLPAQGKLTTEEKLQLSRLEAAAAKAQATLTNFVAQVQRAIQEMEVMAKKARDEHEKIIADMKMKYDIDAFCVFDENQDPKRRLEEKQPDGSVKVTLTDCPAKEEKK